LVLPESQISWQWVKLMVQVAQADRIILIAHEDCRWYLAMGFADDPSHLRERQVQDLQIAQLKLAEELRTAVDLYYVRLDGDRALCEKL
jgi:hypothetical protein